MLLLQPAWSTELHANDNAASACIKEPLYGKEIIDRNRVESSIPYAAGTGYLTKQSLIHKIAG